MSKKITKSDVESALDSFEEAHANLSKASDHDLDEPEGDDMGEASNHKTKMSDAAKSKKAMPFTKKEDDEEEGEGEPEMKAKKSKKAMDAEHVDEDESHSEHHGAPSGKPAKSMTKKSFSEDMPEEIQTKIDVSEFLKSLVDHTGDAVDGLATEVAKSERRMAGRYNDLTSAVEDVQKSQAKIGIVLKAICQRIGIIENAPARAAKSEAVAKSGAQDRKFSSGLEGDAGDEPVFKSLSKNPAVAKSQISESLCDMVRKGEASDLDVIGFETNGFIRPDLMPKLKQALN